MITMDFLRRYWGRPVDILPKNQEKTETFFNLPNGASICFICQEALPQLPLDKKKAAQMQHKRSTGHNKTLSTVNSNGICVVHTPKSWLLFCRICKRHLRSPKENIKGHILDVDHKIWFKQMQDLTIYETELLTTSSMSIEQFLKSETNFAFCEVCHVEVECTATKIKNHTLSSEHRKQLLKALKPFTGLFPIENNNKMWCKICDIRFDNNVEVLLQHLTENLNHGRWFHDVDLMTNQDVSVNDYLTDEKELMAKCYRCDLKIKADPKNILAHVHSEPHRFRHRNYSLGPVKSLALQDIWPSWCHWNYFRHSALDDLNFWPS